MILAKMRTFVTMTCFTLAICIGFLFAMMHWNVLSYPLGKIDVTVKNGYARDIQDPLKEAYGTFMSSLYGPWAVNGVLWEMHALVHHLLGKGEMYNFAVIRLPDGRMYAGGVYPQYTYNAMDLAKDIALFSQKAAEKGTKLFVLSPPDKVLKNAPPLPPDIPFSDYNNAIDAFLHTLKGYGIPSLDARYSLHQRKVPSDSVLPRSDFMLSGESAFSIFQDLTAALEKEFSLALDQDGFFTDPANYSFEKRENFYLGYMGKRSGVSFAGRDDFTTVIPRFETDVRFESIDMFENILNASGPIANTLLDPSALTNTYGEYTFYPYTYYRHTNAAWSKIRNLRKDDGPTLLFVHDHYTAQIIGHIAPLFKEVHTLAYHENFALSVSQYIESNKVDYIVISFLPQHLLKPDVQMLFK